MRPNPEFERRDPAVVADLVRANPWGTIVSGGGGGLVASHYPLMLDDEADGLAILTHVGKPDEELHGLGESEILDSTEGAERTSGGVKRGVGGSLVLAGLFAGRD